MFRSIVLLVGGLASLWAASLSAQDAVLGQKYGSGVHAYFAGDYLKAYDQLTAAINGGSKDPRAFYFRGLTYMNLGRGQDAKQDFQQGAGLESSDVNKFYNVSKALERVQGPARIELENYRVDARMAAMDEAERLHKARYEAIQREETRVLREQPPAPPESIKTGEPIVEKPIEPAAADPFGTPAEKPAAGKKGGLLGAMGKALGKAVGGDDAKSPAEKNEKPAAEKTPAKAEKPAEEKPADKEVNPDDPFAQ